MYFNGTRKAMHLLGILTMFEFINCLILDSPSCKVADIRTKQNFDNSKYVGTWHELYYESKGYYGPDDLWEDYTETYTIEQGGNLHLVGRGRKPSKRDQECEILYTGTLLQSEESGKFNRTSRRFHTPFWILDTDYTHFSVTYGCRAEDPRGGCTLTDKLDIWVWSRNETLSADHMTHVRTILQDVCVDFSRLKKTPINRDCTVPAAIGR